MQTIKIYLGDIYIADFGHSTGCVIGGNHPCIVVRKVGSLVSVVPISSKVENLHWSEMIIPIGCSGLYIESKAKVSQLRPIDEWCLGRRIGTLGLTEREHFVELLRARGQSK